MNLNHRVNDHDTSVAGAHDVATRSPNQKVQLLRQFRRAGDLGLTDEEAADQAGLLRSCYWKRCGELRRLELIAYTETKRKGTAGLGRKVSVITAEGLELLRTRAV